ncbi:TipAS antibiotic-recognition domain-containing protein [Arthrobacter sp. CAN_C5]|uniref:TipAS antibiotic-recognition domain-containing protein n=1 Tax=Arthrobacter sp. CAN_C5 TaxID=2760706 RepID=UPI001AE83F9D|nr:TipAS antibiotic-recognition domain-containing protein [Arthrobacter sp. CAN_C5]MBP2216537.1 hypothetical protein [Arthrobacter sp. CAN_C5]
MTGNSKLTTTYLQTSRDALAKEQATSLAATNGWAHVDRDKVHADWDAIYRELAEGLEQRSPDDQSTQDLIHRHYQIACRFYTPSPEAYIGMALFYRENEDMNAFHNGYHKDMVEFLVYAMAAYAQHRL